MSWWFWVLFGFCLLIIELVTPGGPFILFFGIGALAVGLVAALAAVQAWLQWALFPLFSVVALFLLRGPLRARLNLDGGNKEVDSLVGCEAVLLDDLVPGGVAKAEFRGSSWSARSTAAGALAKGQRCRIAKVEGLTLWLLPD